MKLTTLTPFQIKHRRKNAGFTQTDCANKCGIKLRSWQYFEAGSPMREIYIKIMGWDDEHNQ